MNDSSKWCIHYQAMVRHDECKAGVRYDSLPKRGTPEFMESCPCFGGQGDCEKSEYMTPEQVVEMRAKWEERFASTATARKAIVEHLGGPWKLGTPGATGVIDCPVCKGVSTLQFSRAGYNGHTHAACKTDGCVRWME